MKRLTVSGWQPQFRPISFIKLLRESGVQNLRVREAKGIVDQILAGQPVDLYFGTAEDANSFVQCALSLGAIASTPADIPDELFASIRQSQVSVAQSQQHRDVWSRVDVSSVCEGDINSLADAWLNCSRLQLSSPERAELEWVISLQLDLLEEAPDKL
jgi:hypothetical protein